MKSLKTAIHIITLFVIFNSANAQDSLLKQMAIESKMLFTYEEGKFNGEGWEYVLNKSKASASVLIGEDHFSNEIPSFISALANNIKFDNFYIEVDPYSTTIIENSIKKLTKEQLQEFNAEYSHLFSFYANKPEYELLYQIMMSDVKLLGSDQIVMYADRLIFQDVVKHTLNPKVREIYIRIMEQSQLHLDRFYKNPENPMYFMTPVFSRQLDSLENLKLSPKEALIISDMKESVVIYQEMSHRKRVQLIKHQLMNDYPRWSGSKNLFKYGANHVARGESFLTVTDIGNLVANITEANYEESFHIMIVGESGMLGSPFKGFPPAPVDTETGFYLSYLKPFFSITEGSQWHLFDLIPLRKVLEKNKLNIDNLNLARVIKGFDALIIIPHVTAAKF